MTTDRPSIFGVVPFATNTALPDKDTTTASKGCALAESVTSQTATRSLSITGFRAVCGSPRSSSAQSRSVGIMGLQMRLGARAMQELLFKRQAARATVV